MQALLQSGFVKDELRYLRDWFAGNAHPTAGGWVISQRLLAARTQLSSDAELVMALLAQQPELRTPWLRLAAARCQEAGQLADELSLVDMVSRLGAAAEWVEDALPEAVLVASPTAALERELLGASVEQAAARPALLRFLATGHWLASGQFIGLSALPAVDRSGFLADQNWIPGRLLALPDAMANGAYVLRGAGELEPPAMALLQLPEHRVAEPRLDVYVKGSSGTASAVQASVTLERQAPSALVLRWLMHNPWAFLLAAVVYAQDAWAAECRGGLLLELPVGQPAHAPAEIAVLVQSPEGAEVACGSLADLLLRSLSYLGMACFPIQPSAQELNAQLSLLIGQLLSRKVWRYVEAASGSRGQYQIHSKFADEAYRTTGSKVIKRAAGHVWLAVRVQAEEMKSLAQANAGVGVHDSKEQN